MATEFIDLDRRVTVLEVKIDEHFRTITELKSLMNRLGEKIDTLIQLQTITKTKVGLMWAGYAAGIVAVLEIILRTFIK